MGPVRALVKRRQWARGPWDRAPRVEKLVEADAVGMAEGNTGESNRRAASPGPRLSGSTGVKGQGTRAMGLPRNLGDLDASRVKPGTATQARVSVVGTPRSRSAAISSDEAGEPT